MKNKTLLATVAALLAQVIFGFSFMFTKSAFEFAAPITVIAVRYAVAFVGMTAVLLVSRMKLHFGKGVWKLLLMSVFQPVMYFLFESYGIQMTTSSFSSVMISLIPVVSMISGIFLLGEIPTLLQYLFSALSVGGIVIMSLIGKAEGTVTPLGIILLFGAVVSAVAYNVMSRKISARFSAFERTYAMMLVGMVVFVGIALVSNISAPINIFLPLRNPPFVVSVLYLGLLSSVVAFLLLNYANTHLPVSKTTAFANITTVVSVIAGALFLSEKITLLGALAIGMIIVGVWGVQMQGVKKK